MSYEISYPATMDLARLAYRRTVWRDTLGWRIGLLLVGAISAVAVFAKAEPVFAGFGLGATFAFAVAWWISRASYAGRAADAVREAGTIRWRFEEDSLVCRSDDREGTFQWKAIRRLRRFPDVWILQFGETPTPLPPADLGPELREFLERKIREAGGRVD